MAFWWVNHKQIRDHEVRGGYLWSPMRNANGSFNQTYQDMTLVRPGDIVFSYANGRIGAIGTVTEAASASPKPTAFVHYFDERPTAAALGLFQLHMKPKLDSN
jgi:putative restriction endonuclease